VTDAGATSQSWRKWFDLDRGDTSVPYGQGDLVLVPTAVLISPEELPGTGAPERRPRPMAPNSGLTRLFDASPDGAVLETWARTGYTLAIVLTHDCGFDQDYLRYISWLVDSQNLERAEAEKRARLESAPWLRVGVVWAVPDLPAHQRADAEHGRVGFLRLPDMPLAPEGSGPFAVNLEQACSLSWRAVDNRLAVATPATKRLVQRALCYADAARNIELADAVTRLFNRPILRIEPQEGLAEGRTNQQVRSLVHFADGDQAVVEISFRIDVAPESPVTARPPESGRGGRRN
jgi:hypothetical protein